MRSSRQDHIDEAIADANRTLSKKNTGNGYYKVIRMDTLWMRYDEEKDGLVPCEGPVITIIPTPTNRDGTLA